MAWQRIVIDRFGGPEVMALRGADALPEPGPGEVRVQVWAAGTGATDTLVRRGDYPGVKGRLPLTPGYDWVGVVDALGPAVSGVALGDRVADLSVTGGYAQYLTVAAERLLPVPAQVDPAEAVCMLLPYGTAYQMLTRLRPLPVGASCLIHGGGGAVGTALLDLCRHLGLKAIATGSPGKRALIESYGARFIDYRSEDFVARVAQMQPAGVDAAFDTIGGRSWSRSRQCLAEGGLLVGFGALALAQGRESTARIIAGFAKLLALWPLLPDGRHYAFYNIESRRRKLPQQFRDDMVTLFRWLQEGKLHPAIAGRMPLAEAVAAHRRIEAGEPQGRIVLDCRQTPG